MKILLVGDIFANPGRRALRRLFPLLRAEFEPDLVIANAENAAGGFGITLRIARDLKKIGVDVITTGNHIWHKSDINDHLDTLPYLLRPLNYPESNPGRGIVRIVTDNGVEVVVVNLIGRVFLQPTDCPFRSVASALDKLPPPPEQGRIVVVDMHAEATSEKMAMGHFLDGKVALVAGTHTHVQTADERILEHGTAYITDVGFTGSRDSVIGHDKTRAIAQFLNTRRCGFRIADRDVCVEGVLLNADPCTGLATGITRFRKEESAVLNAADTIDDSPQREDL